MSVMTEMMQSMPRSERGMELDMMQECIEACSAAAMAATMCADADSREGMGRCASMCANLADVAGATMRMMMRPNGYELAVMQATMTACMATGAACATECREHAAMSEHCRVCATACETMVDACRRTMSAMGMG